MKVKVIDLNPREVMMIAHPNITITQADKLCLDNEGKVRRFTRYQKSKGKRVIGIALEDQDGERVRVRLV